VNGEVHIEAPPPGRYGINFHPLLGEVATPLGHLRSEFESVAGDPVVVVIKCAANGRVEGTLLLPDGSPAPAWLVQLEPGLLRTKTDADGRFAFDAVPPGEKQLVVREGMTDLRLARIDVPPQGTLRCEVDLPGTGTVTGRFVSARGGDNAHLILRRKSGGDVVARAYFYYGGGDGTFRVPYLAPGDYELVARLRIGSVRRLVTVTSGTVDVGDMEIEATPEVPVVATAPAGVKVAGEIQVRATGEGGDAYGWLALGDDGRGFLRGLRPGRYRLSFTVAGCAPLEIDVELEAESPRPLAFALLPR